MSKQTATNPLPHIHAVTSAVRLPDQPMATFRALDAAMDAVLGHTCLLYTSPSPRDGLLSRMPSSA